ncbi:matrixin family metalloprotease [bacterium]|nr:matrixin family metalloprotease [bacterium]
MLACAAPATATTFVRMDAPQLAARSDVAVVATVREVATVGLENGAAVTRVVLLPEQVVLGAVPAGPLVLDEPGGRAGGRVERIFGAPEYQPGARVLAFLQHTAGGTLRTTGMAMGKYDLAADGTAIRSFGDVLLLDPADAAPIPPSAGERLADVLGGLAAKAIRPAAAARTIAARVPAPPAAPFTYLGDPSRWFEADAGQPIRFLIDGRGDAALGRAVALDAAADALATWSSIDGASLLLEDGLLDAPASFAGCDGANRVVFDDPFDEIDDPVDCRGILGIGGYCYADERRDVGGVEYRRIRVGKATIANGWGGCPQWTACNLAQIVTHELGHTVGLGHSPDETATMSGTARFDGRCAALAADDLAGARAIYPVPDTPTPTVTRTPPPSATATARPPATATARPPTRTPSPAGARGIRGRITYYGSGLPVPGARVRLRGAGTAIAVTQGGGDYGVDDLAAGAWTVEPQKTADPNSGAITALDAAIVLQASAGARALDAEHRIACDATGNGSVSPLDAARILQLVTGAIPALPARDLCGSDFVFFPSPSSAPNQERIAPALDVTGCRAGALSYAPLTGQLAGQSFRAALIGDCDSSWQPAEARSAEPLLAPAGTALQVSPPRRLPGGRWRVAVGLSAPASASALEVELRYDGAQLLPTRVRTAHLGDAALVDFTAEPPGRLRLALASAIPLPIDGRALLVVDFTAAGDAAVTGRSVRAWSARMDDRVIPIAR